jgi:hypothetical protein
VDLLLKSDFYNEVYKKRRCQVGLHNFTTFESDEALVLICRVCKHFQVGQNKMITGDSIDDNKKTYKGVHQDRDGFINYDRTY